MVRINAQPNIALVADLHAFWDGADVNDIGGSMRTDALASYSIVSIPAIVWRSRP